MSVCYCASYLKPMAIPSKYVFSAPNGKLFHEDGKIIAKSRTEFSRRYSPEVIKSMAMPGPLLLVLPNCDYGKFATVYCVHVNPLSF